LFQTLARFYGTDDISFTFVSDEFNGITRDANGEVRPLVARTFDSLTEAKVENAQSRIYLGIHWRFDADEGIRTGDQVAAYVFETFLRTRNTGEGGEDGGRGHSGSHAGASAAGLGEVTDDSDPVETTAVPDDESDVPLDEGADGESGSNTGHCNNSGGS